MGKFCEYGCCQEAKYILKNGKFCCSKIYNSCPVSRKNNSERNKGRIISPETIEKIRNKNLGKQVSEETKKKIKLAKLGKKLSDYHKNKLKNKKGVKLKFIDKNILCDYGCGNIALYIFRNKKKCCSETFKSCLNIRNKIGNKQKGKIVAYETRKKLSIAIKSLSLSGSKSPNWKGSNGKPLYDTYASKLEITDDCRRNLYNKNILDVKCSVCGNFFEPSLNNVTNRLAAINGIQGGEHKFYCSDECKNSCSVYGKKLYQKEHPKTTIYTQTEYEQFRDYVLNRDNYKCQYCGKLAEHVHHERPQKLEPFFSLDPDLAWSVCKKCHYKKGHIDQCSTSNIAQIIC